MTEHPIIMNGESVRAILAGRKSQTRRVIKPQPTGYGLVWIENDCGFAAWQDDGLLLDEGSQRLCPHGRVGDLLWVRETWANVWNGEDASDGEHVEYRADLPAGCTDYPGQWPAEYAIGSNDAPKWRASIHMPRRASRVTLRITDVRVQTVQEIGYDDIIAEGWDVRRDAPVTDGTCGDDAREWFRRLWDGINAKRGYPWAVDPWVFAITFQVFDK